MKANEVMNSDEFAYMTIKQAASLIRTKQLSPVELVESALARITRLESHLKVFITLTPDIALEAARVAEAEVMAGSYRGPLHGIPIAHKDVLCTAGVRTTGHCMLFATNVPDADAAVVRDWGQAGAISLGKTNTYELASGRDQSLFGIPANPWNRTRVTGGSSTGSGGGLAAGYFFGASGTDGGGSIRAPAAHCGVVGFRPTFGLVSTSGMLTGGWSSTNCVGPLGRTVEDVKVLFKTMASSNRSNPQPYVLRNVESASGLSFRDSLEGLRVGVPLDFFFDSESFDSVVIASVRDGIAKLQELGADILEVRMPNVEMSSTIHSVISSFETNSSSKALPRAAWDKIGYLTRLSLELGQVLSPSTVMKAIQLRQLVREDFTQAFEEVDILVTPTTVGTALSPEGDLSQPPLPRPPASLAGCPALSLPCGASSEGLPIGLQLIGRRWQDDLVLEVASLLESVIPKRPWPDLSKPSILPGLSVPDFSSPLGDEIADKSELLTSEIDRLSTSRDLDSLQAPFGF